MLESCYVEQIGACAAQLGQLPSFWEDKEKDKEKKEKKEKKKKDKEEKEKKKRQSEALLMFDFRHFHTV